MVKTLKRFTLIMLAAAVVSTGNVFAAEAQKKRVVVQPTRHFVAFKFKGTATEAQKKSVREAFLGLKKKIPLIVSIEWGSNTSPENLSKEMTDGFLLTFKSAKDRDQYLIHPEHVKFKNIALPLVADAFIFDYAF